MPTLAHMHRDAHGLVVVADSGAGRPLRLTASTCSLCACQVRCEAGRVVCREGDKGDFFYIAESGVYAVYKSGELLHTYRIEEDAHGNTGRPSFGEVATMGWEPSTSGAHHRSPPWGRNPRPAERTWTALA